MKTIGIGKFTPKLIEKEEVNKKKDYDKQFGDVLTGFVKSVNTDQLNSKQVVADFVAGKDVELHEVMIAGEKAKTSLELLMQIRNKTVDMYKELTRMQ